MYLPTVGACVLVLTQALAAQRYVVNAVGPGDFSEISAAIAAVPEGATILVKPGKYASFSIRDKALTIVAEAQPCYVPWGSTAPVVVWELSPGKRVLLSGLKIGQDVVLANNLGTVVLHGVDSSRDGMKWTISGCADVHLLDSTVNAGGSGTQEGTSLDIQDSTVEVTRCGFLGRIGRFGYDGFGGPGGTGAVVTRSRLWLAQSMAAGGLGGVTYVRGNPVGLPGGTGLRVASSTVVVYGSSNVLGEKAGAGLYAAAGGNGIEADASSQVTVLGGNLAGAGNGKAFVGPVTWLPERVTPSLNVSGTVLPNETVHLQLTATPDSVAVLVVGLQPALAPQPFLQVGALFVTPGIVLGPFTTDASGTLDLPVGIPVGYPGAVPAFVQCASLDLANASFAASGSAVLLGRY